MNAILADATTPASASATGIAIGGGTSLVMIATLVFWALYRVRLHHPKDSHGKPLDDKDAHKDHNLRPLDLTLAMLLGIALSAGFFGTIGKNLLSTGDTTVAGIMQPADNNAAQNTAGH